MECNEGTPEAGDPEKFVDLWLEAGHGSCLRGWHHLAVAQPAFHPNRPNSSPGELNLSTLEDKSCTICMDLLLICLRDMSSRVVELNVPWRFLAFYLLLQIWANHNHSGTAGLDSLQLLDLSAWCTSQESRRKPILPCMSGGWIQLFSGGFWNKDSHQWRLIWPFLL